MDPVTGRTLSPLCIARVADPELREKLTTMSYFTEKEVVAFKESGCNARGMMGPLTVWAYASGIVCAGLFVTAIASLPLLDNPAWGWLPVLTFVLGGGLLIFVYIAFMRKSQCALLIAGGAAYEIAAERYISKFNGGEKVATAVNGRDRSLHNT